NRMYPHYMRGRTMRAAVWNDKGSLDVVDRPVPEPKPGWVRIAVASAGICGTDLHIFTGDFPSPAGLLPGHEVGGVVDLACGGAAVEPLAVCVRGTRRAGVGLGDRVMLLGSGTIGLLSILTARAAGAGQVAATGRYPHQREAALAFGADVVSADGNEAASALGP